VLYRCHTICSTSALMRASILATRRPKLKSSLIREVRDRGRYVPARSQRLVNSRPKRSTRSMHGRVSEPSGLRLDAGRRSRSYEGSPASRLLSVVWLASYSDRAPAGGTASVSGDTDTIYAVHTRAARFTNCNDQPARLLDLHGWHSLCRRCEGQDKSNSNPSDHRFLPFVVVWRQVTMHDFVSGLSAINDDRRLELRHRYCRLFQSRTDPSECTEAIASRPAATLKAR
jgi:hypothetical protein